MRFKRSRNSYYQLRNREIGGSLRAVRVHQLVRAIAEKLLVRLRFNQHRRRQNPTWRALRKRPKQRPY